MAGNKHIFFLNHSLAMGGAERVMSTLANYWSQQGYQVTLVTLSDTSKDFYQLDAKVTHISLALDKIKPNLFHTLANNLKRIIKIRQLLKHYQPDVAIAMMPTPNVLLALSSWLLPIISIGSERVYPPSMPLGRLGEKLRAWFYPKLDFMVAQTQATLDWIKQHAPAKHNLIIPNPINYPIAITEPKINPDTLFNSHAASRILLAVGRLDHQKGFDLLINTFAQIIDKHPDWHLVILGEGQDREKLTHLIQDYQLLDKISLAGAVGNLSDWYQTADLFVLSSRFEGYPNTLIEAMSYGLAAVAFDCPSGPSDIIEHGENGLLIKAGDLQGLANILDELMTNQQLAIRLGQAAGKIKHSLETKIIATQWQQLFE